jgi:DNA-binding NarL/FixJ family response regulator
MAGYETHSKQRLPWENLTDRHKEIIPYIAKGLLDKEIANELNISERTVKNHISKINRILNIASKPEIAYFAIRDGFIEPNSDKPRLPWGSLTECEAEVAQWKARGYSNKGISSKLGISEHILKHHVSDSYKRLGVENQRELTYFAMRDKFVEY